jgi:uncharacterized protein
VEALDLTSMPLPLAVGVALGFFAIAVAISIWWRGRFRYGPLEWAMRVLTDRPARRPAVEKNE